MARLQKSIWRAKDSMWNEYLKNLWEHGVWGAVKFANPCAGTTVDALTDSEGMQAITLNKNEEFLRCQAFPPNEHDQYFELPLPGQAHLSVTEQAVQHALFLQSVGKTPRLEKLSVVSVHLLQEWEKIRIVELAKAVIETGRHPAVWKQASGVIICKPGIDNYTELKGHHFISVIHCMGKDVEKVVAELPADKAERWGLHCDGQYGSRKRWSAIDAAAIWVYSTHAAWRDGHIGGVLLMDIKAAFRSLVWGRLITTMRGKGMDRDIIRWRESIPTAWTVDMVIDRNVLERHPVEAVLPQGSPVSLILFAIFMSGFIKSIEERVSAVEGLSFVDDVRWVATGNNVTQVMSKDVACAQSEHQLGGKTGAGDWHCENRSGTLDP